MTRPNRENSVYQLTGIQNFKNCDESDVVSIAADLALVARKSDLITLSGDLGAGKTAFARAFIRQYLQLPDLEIPSPTYLLALQYANDMRQLITHMDLYRISQSDEIEELAIEEAVESGIVLIEWPLIARAALATDPIDISFEITGEFTRNLSISGGTEAAQRFQRSALIGKFLRQNIGANYSRIPIPGDASVRDYEIIKIEGNTRILMNAPKTTDGPPVKNGLPYSQIAHLAEEVRPFVALAHLLRMKGFYAPQIFAHDCENGLVLMEHLGEDGIIDGEHQPIGDRYIDCGKLLASIHAMKWPKAHRFGEEAPHTIPCYDEQAMHIETELLSEWYLGDGKFCNSTSTISDFTRIWSQYCRTAQTFRKSIVLRDYHSPNIIWRNCQHAHNRIGLIDFQDAMIGPAVYDLVSLAQDARVTIPQELEQRIKRQYLETLNAIGEPIDEQQFEFEYALMGAQRASKLLGIFVRLHTRDGKSGYRKLIPAIRVYLKRNLQHPQLSQYRQWCERVIGL